MTTREATVWDEVVVRSDGTMTAFGRPVTVAERTLIQVNGKFLNLVNPVARYLEGSLHFDVTGSEVPLNKLPEGLRFTVLKSP